MQKYDIAVVGGGASGLMAAYAAAREGAVRVAVLERNDRVGRKLLATGNGRCNLTNRNADGSRYHGGSAAGEILSRFPPQKIIEIFGSMGLWCRELEAGRVYPFSLQASSVLNFLRRTLEAEGVSVLCDFPVEQVKAGPEGFLLTGGENAVAARRVVLAAGGKAGPQFGTDGNAFPVLKSLGHSVTALHPALVPVRTDPSRVKPLRGVRSPARATLYRDGKAVASTVGEVQFADGVLSGICIFELARYLGDDRAHCEISLNFLPDFAPEETEQKLCLTRKFLPALPASQLLEGMLPKALAVEVSRAALGDPMKPAGSLSEKDYHGLARMLSDFRFPALGTRNWDAAQVTAGGVPLSETDENLQSKFHSGLYLCGELLDVDGDCGGYNLQWAWASGLVAGSAAAKR